MLSGHDEMVLNEMLDAWGVPRDRDNPQSEDVVTSGGPAHRKLQAKRHGLVANRPRGKVRRVRAFVTYAHAFRVRAARRRYA